MFFPIQEATIYCDHEYRIEELKKSLKNIQEEVLKSALDHEKICVEKDSIIDHLQMSITDMEMLLQVRRLVTLSSFVLPVGLAF